MRVDDAAENDGQGRARRHDDGEDDGAKLGNCVVNEQLTRARRGREDCRMPHEVGVGGNKCN